jgi:hypothetical protein
VSGLAASHPHPHRAQEVHLAQRQALIAQHAVGSRGVEEEVGQREGQQEILYREGHHPVLELEAHVTL